MKIRASVFVFLLGLLAVACSSSTPPIDPATAQLPGPTLLIGALINQDPMGDPDTQAALALAEADINEYLAAAGLSTRIRLVVEGTGLDPDRALAGLVSLQAQGIRTVVGPETSGELEAILQQAAAEGTVLISHCSTASSLSIAGDSVFRLVPNDLSQTDVIADLIAASGRTQVVLVFRDDIFGQDLSAALTPDLQDRGIAVAGQVAYDPALQDYGGVAAQIAQAVQAAPGPVAIQLSGFGPDAALLLQAAAAQGGLDTLPWFGSDGTALSREILNNPAAAAFAAQTGLANPLFAATPSAKAERLLDRIEMAASTEAQVCSLTAYDAVWLAAQITLLTAEPERLAALVPPTADNYFGASGWTALDPTGDRLTANYDVWQLVDQGGVIEWQSVAQVSAREDPLLSH